MSIKKDILQERIKQVIQCIAFFEKNSYAWNYLREQSVKDYLLIKVAMNTGNTFDYCFPDFPKTRINSSEIQFQYDEYKSYLKKWDKDIAETFSEYWIPISSDFMNEEAFIDISTPQLAMIVGDWMPNEHKIKIAHPSVLQFIKECETNSLGQTANSYIDFVESLEETLEDRDDLNILLTRLPDLALNPNYVLDDFRSRDETNSVLYLYARNKNLKRPKVFEYKSESSKNKCRVWMPLKVWGITIGKIKKRIILDELFQYITVPFTEEAIWQAYLLNNTYHLIGMRWHGAYDKRTFINSYVNIDSINADSVKKEIIKKMWNPEMQPIVTLRKNQAYITHYWFDDWKGLVQVNCEVIYNPNKKQILAFQPKEQKILVEYNCGIFY